MFPVSSRRDFLRVLAGGATGLSLSSRMFGQQPSSPPLTTTRLSADLVHIAGAGGNVVVAIGPEGVVMVNGGLREHSDELLKTIAAQSGKPIQTLFNTDWHPEHTGSNEALGAAGVQIVAHEHTRQYLSTDLVVEWQHRTYKARARQALPTQTFYTSGSMNLGTERIEYAHLGQAHTDGDIYVHFPASNVLVAGDVLSVGRYPIADHTTGGWLGGLLTANKKLLDLANATTRIIPGIGPIQTRADLQAQHDMLATLRDRMAKMMKQGMGAHDMLAAGVTAEFNETWGDPEPFVSATYRGMWLHVRELGGIV